MNTDVDLAELKQHLDLVRGNHQLDVLGALTALLARVEEHGDKLHSMFSKWHGLDATVRVNAKETDAELNKVAASTGEVRNVLNTLLGNGFGGLETRVDEVRKKLLQVEAATADLNARVKTVEKTGVDVVQDLLRLADRLDKAENGLRVVDQGTAFRLEALEKAGPVMERFLGLDGKGPEPAELGLSGPWPLRALVERLARGCVHLLVDHNCDELGYETLIEAISAAEHRFALGLSLPPGWRERLKEGGK